MSAYTINGYLAALELRSARRTLLVEGQIDRMFVERLLHELTTQGRGRRERIAVDTADMIKAEGRGARELLEMLHGETTSSRMSFGALVDREYRSFAFAPVLTDMAPEHRVLNDSLFWTRGHSVENYILTERAIRKFLQVNFPHVLDLLSNQLRETLESAIRWAAAVSIAAFEAGHLGRCKGACDHQMWGAAGGVLQLSVAEFSNALVARGAPQTTADQIANRARGVFVSLTDPATAGLARWLAQGHLGFELMWSACAALARSAGVAPGECDRVAHGLKDVKARLAFDDWISVEFGQQQNGEMPNAFVEWCALA